MICAFEASDSQLPAVEHLPADPKEATVMLGRISLGAKAEELPTKYTVPESHPNDREWAQMNLLS